jgi:ketosteroid isomerase-like protein
MEGTMRALVVLWRKEERGAWRCARAGAPDEEEEEEERS